MVRISQTGPVVVLRNLPSNMCYGIGKISHVAFNVVSRAFQGIAHFFAAIKNGVCRAFNFLGSRVSSKTPPNAPAINTVAAQALPAGPAPGAAPENTAPIVLKVELFATTPLAEPPVIEASGKELESTMEETQVDPATQGSTEMFPDDVTDITTDEEDEAIDAAVEAALAAQIANAAEESSLEEGPEMELNLTSSMVDLDDEELSGDEAMKQRTLMRIWLKPQ